MSRKKGMETWRRVEIISIFVLPDDDDDSGNEEATTEVGTSSWQVSQPSP